MGSDQVLVHTDGGARGNPGPAACAFVINIDGELWESSEFLEKNTNNFAEYRGVVLALKWLVDNKEKIGDRDIKFFLDSELVVKQIHGTYRVKDENLKLLFYEVFLLIKTLSKKTVFSYIPRSDNKRADFLVNKELDSRR